MLTVQEVLNLPLDNNWHAKASADNAVATATKPGETGKRQVITHIQAGYTAAKTGILTVKDGNTVIAEIPIENAAAFPCWFVSSEGNAISAELAASGGAGNLGKVNLQGVTR